MPRKVGQHAAHRTDIAVGLLHERDFLARKNALVQPALGRTAQSVGHLRTQGVDRCAAGRGASRVVGVDGHEQCRLVALGELAPLLEGNERIRIARHHHLVTAGGVELLAQLQAERKHDVLLDRAEPGSARIVTAVTGIDDDHRLVGAGRADLRRHRGLGHRRLQTCGTEAERSRPHGRTRLDRRRRFGSGHDVDRELCRLAVGPFSMSVLSTTTGPVTSMITRDLPGADIPWRNDLMRPTGVSPRASGSTSLTSGRSTSTRLGCASAETSKSTWRSKLMMNRVRVVSILAAGAFSAGLILRVVGVEASCCACSGGATAKAAATADDRTAARKPKPASLPKTMP